MSILERNVCEKRNHQYFRQTCNESRCPDGILFFAVFDIYRGGEYFFIHVLGRRVVVVARFFHGGSDSINAGVRDYLRGGSRRQHFTLLQFCCVTVGWDTGHVARSIAPSSARESIIQRVDCPYKVNMILFAMQNERESPALASLLGHLCLKTRDSTSVFAFYPPPFFAPM